MNISLQLVIDMDHHLVPLLGSIADHGTENPHLKAAYDAVVEARSQMFQAFAGTDATNVAVIECLKRAFDEKRMREKAST
jgi:hypothetical protein